MSEILAYFPSHLTPRPQQVEFLKAVEAGWAEHDLFMGCLPTGVGKTEVMLTIARWCAARNTQSTISVPTNILVEQFHGRYPEVQVLHKKDYYECTTDYVAAKKAAKRSLVRLVNTYVYWAHKVYAPVVMFDEAHQLLDMLQDKRDVKMWRSQWGFPDGLQTVADVIEWGQSYLEHTPDETLARALREVARIDDGAIVVYSVGRRGRKPDVLLHVVPSTARTVPPWLWPPHRVHKLIFLSATISKQDVDELGLSYRKSLYIETSSPIPSERRPVIYEPTYNMSRECVRWALPMLAKKLHVLLDRHPEKGLVHLPYSLAEQLRPLISHSRLLFHDNENKAEVLDRFRNSLPSEGLVLVASGLFEGIDLKYDDARWQVIAKTPYLSLGDPRTAEKAKTKPDWYAWQAVKHILQACGRIVRAEDDQGTSYILDTTFINLWRKSKHLFPAYFRDALKGV